MAQAAENCFWRRMQINHVTALVQVVAIGLPQNNTASGRKHTGAVLRQLINDALLKITKRLFALALKKFANRATSATFYDKVRIEKTKIQTPCQLSANR